MPQSQREQRQSIPRDQIPFWNVISNAGPLSELATAFIKWEVKQSELARIDAELGELARERPSMDELRENVRHSWDKYYQRAVSRMAKFIANGAVNSDYLSRLERAAVGKALVLVPWELCEAALDAVAAGGYSGLPADEKQKEISSRQKKRKKIVDEMEQLLPSETFANNDPRSNAVINAAQAFFDSWRSLQIWTTDLCDYQGKVLTEADDEVQRAHSVLGLAGLRSRAAKLSAYVPPETVA